MSLRSDILVLALAVLAYAGVLLAMQASAPVVGVLDLVREPARFDGRMVKVRGWTTRCLDEDCSIASSRRYFDLLHRDPLALRAKLKAKEEKLLSFTFSPMLDRRLDRLAGREVVVPAYFNAVCLDGHTFCFDRAPQLRQVWFAAPYALKDS